MISIRLSQRFFLRNDAQCMCIHIYAYEKSNKCNIGRENKHTAE